jgi:predicted membrane-bound spermidine synthase
VAPTRSIPLPLIYGLFLISGASALLYQVVWQRSLFSLYGVNVEAVTIVVSAFMLGLGLGSFAGGKASKVPGAPLPLWFGLVELGIGLFGLVSLPLFRFVGDLTAGASGLATFGLSFALVLVPTLLMGSTLPMLVAYSVRASQNVGKSVGMLYFINTLGSALASIAAGVWVMGALGQSGSVLLAACGNLLIGLTVLIWWFKGGRTATAG